MIEERTPTATGAKAFKTDRDILTHKEGHPIPLLDRPITNKEMILSELALVVVLAIVLFAKGSNK